MDTIYEMGKCVGFYHCFTDDVIRWQDRKMIKGNYSLSLPRNDDAVLGTAVAEEKE